MIQDFPYRKTRHWNQFDPSASLFRNCTDPANCQQHHAQTTPTSSTLSRRNTLAPHYLLLHSSQQSLSLPSYIFTTQYFLIEGLLATFAVLLAKRSHTFTATKEKLDHEQSFVYWACHYIFRIGNMFQCWTDTVDFS